ncbi:hypothetical protein AB0K00_43525 [Dactylosporangium sp. NPDC049525]|uniref:hypothetical protein n=1 Tax=Dactylosporangium sp. NPDC049525 TaxID=3154730 RepID=UPI003439EB46
MLPEDPEHLLIALPAVGDQDPPTRVRRAVVRSLRAVGATHGITKLADDLLQHRACILLQ